MTLAPATENALIFTRTINAPAAQVYRAFTDRDWLRDWFCDDAHLNAVEGGYILLVWNTNYHTAGTFRKLEENKHIVYTWRGTGEETDTLVDIAIDENEGTTELTLTHSGDISGEAADAFRDEWEIRLNHLVTVLETGADPRITERVIIGIFPGGVSDIRAKELGIDPVNAVTVNGLVDGYGAERAGLQVNDVIAAVDGKNIAPDANLSQLIGDKKPGDSVEITFYHGTEKITKTMELTGYPVPEIPEDFKAFSESLKQTYADLDKALSDLLEGVSDADAAKPPAEGEWSANDVIAHLILTERYLQNWLGGLLQGPEISGYNCNTTARIKGVTQTFVGKDAMLAEMRRAWKETVTLIKNFPPEALERKTNLWWAVFEAQGLAQHAENHLPQIAEAIKAAQS